MSVAVPFGGRILVELVRKPTTGGEQGGQNVSEAGIIIPDSAENVADCEAIVLAASGAPGFELPEWVALRISHGLFGATAEGEDKEFHTLQARHILNFASATREPRVKVGERILFDITLATEAPDHPGQYFIDQNDIMAIVEEGCLPVSLTKIPTDRQGFRTR
jgi:co-chaperonin GroES (HSP10)